MRCGHLSYVIVIRYIWVPLRPHTCAGLLHTCLRICYNFGSENGILKNQMEMKLAFSTFYFVPGVCFSSSFYVYKCTCIFLCRSLSHYTFLKIVPLTFPIASISFSNDDSYFQPLVFAVL